MELLDGETLAERLGRGALNPGRAIEVAIEILDALGAAHAMGIIRRDLKPANIMLTKSGVKRLDFGLARLTPARVAGQPAAPGAEDSLTAPGSVFGTIPIHGAGAGPRRRCRCAYGSVCVRRRVLRNIDRSAGVQRAITPRAHRGDSREGSARR